MHLSLGAEHTLLWAIFALVYLGMALGRLPGLSLDRTGVAIVGAIAMIGLTAWNDGGAAALHSAAHSVSFETILLLFGLMLFSAQLRFAGFYAVVGRALTSATSRPRRLLVVVILISAALSALLANDIVCLAFTPVLCSSLLAARRDPIPYLIALATSSNIGSAATIIGNPQNMYIGEVGGLSFGHFALTMLPITIVALGMCWVTIVLIWPRSFANGGSIVVDFAGGVGRSDAGEGQPQPSRELAESAKLDRAMVTKTLIILAGLTLSFLYLPAGPRVVAALIGGSLLLITRRRDSARLYRDVDWNLLLLFFGLFVVNGTMKQSGLMAQMMDIVRRQGIDLHRLGTLSAVTALLSNMVSNVPAVLLLQPSIPPDNPTAWYILAMSSTLAGNLTLVGSIANLIVAEQAARLNVKLDLASYCKAGIPLTLASLALGTGWIIWWSGHV